MNGKFTKIAGVILTTSALIGAVWAFDKKYTPREVTEMMIAQVQQNQMTLNKQFQVQNAQQWYWYWQMQVELYISLCAREPRNTTYRDGLTRAKQNRDTWKSKVYELMQ